MTVLRDRCYLTCFVHSRNFVSVADLWKNDAVDRTYLEIRFCRVTSCYHLILNSVYLTRAKNRVVKSWVIISSEGHDSLPGVTVFVDDSSCVIVKFLGIELSWRAFWSVVDYCDKISLRQGRPTFAQLYRDCLVQCIFCLQGRRQNLRFSTSGNTRVTWTRPSCSFISQHNNNPYFTAGNSAVVWNQNSTLFASDVHDVLYIHQLFLKSLITWTEDTAIDFNYTLNKNRSRIHK